MYIKFLTLISLPISYYQAAIFSKLLGNPSNKYVPFHPLAIIALRIKATKTALPTNLPKYTNLYLLSSIQ